MASVSSLSGLYYGRKKVREGREDELSPTERKELGRAKAVVELALRPDGTFQREITRGTWQVEADGVILTPTQFGEETSEEMRRRSEEMGRVFSLGFLFTPSLLRIVGDSLESAEPNALIFTEYRREWPRGSL